MISAHHSWYEWACSIRKFLHNKIKGLPFLDCNSNTGWGAGSKSSSLPSFLYPLLSCFQRLTEIQLNSAQFWKHCSIPRRLAWMSSVPLQKSALMPLLLCLKPRAMWHKLDQSWQVKKDKLCSFSSSYQPCNKRAPDCTSWSREHAWLFPWIIN